MRLVCGNGDAVVGWLAVAVVDVEHGERAAQRFSELGEGLRQRVGELGGRPQDAVGVRGGHASVGQLLDSGLVVEGSEAVRSRPQTGSGPLRSLSISLSFRCFDDGEVVVV